MNRLKQHCKKLAAGLLSLILLLGLASAPIAAEAAEEIRPTGLVVEEPNFILVQKTVTGLNETELQTLREKLRITVKGPNTDCTLAYGQGTDAVFWEDADGVWNWKIYGASGGAYTVGETGCTPAELGFGSNVKLNASGTGQVVIDDADINLIVNKETTCSHTDWPVYDGKFFAGALTGKGVAVITGYALSAGQRALVEAALLGGNWKAPVYYYQLDAFGGDEPVLLNLDGTNKSLTYYPNEVYGSEPKPGKIVFRDESNWTHVAAVSYDVGEIRLGDIRLTNAYTHTVDVSVQKAWEDHRNQDGIRPAEVTVRLLADGEDTGKTVQLSQANDWSGTFGELDEYRDGEKIVYTVEETKVAGYQSVITGSAENGFTVTNTHAPETVCVTGKKTWNDDNNRDGKRPDAITIRLYADGRELTDRQITVTADDGWAWSFPDLPKCENGQLVCYTVGEDAVPGYTATFDGCNVTNSYTPGKRNVSVVKCWEDHRDQDGIRPAEVTVRLLADGEDTGKTVQLSQANDWSGTFGELDEYRDGEKIVYTVEETKVAGYQTVITGSAENGFTVTNTHTPAVDPTPDDDSIPYDGVEPHTTPDSPTSAPPAAPPQTGDADRVGSWFLLLAASGAGMLLALTERKRKLR